MQLNTKMADAASCGDPAAPGAESSFSAAYYQLCSELLDPGSSAEVKASSQRDEENLVTAAVNERMKSIRQEICAKMTDWLYEHGGVVEQWPHPDSGCTQQYRLRKRAKQKYRAGFSYFGGEFVYNSHEDRLVRENGELLWRESPYPSGPPVKPEILENSPAENAEREKYIERFQELFEEERANADKTLEAARAELEELKQRTDFRAPEVIELSQAKADLMAARRKTGLPARALVPLILLLIVVLFTLPGYVFALMGGMPEGVSAAMEATYAKDVWYAIPCYVAYIVWNLPMMPIWLLEMLSPKVGLVGRIIVLLILAAVETVGVLYLVGVCAGEELERCDHERKERPARIKAAQARLDKAQKAFDCTDPAANERCRKVNAAATEQRIADLQQKIEELKELKSDSGNMKLWHKRFEDYKKGEGYRSAQERDLKVQETCRRELASYQKAMAEYKEKQELCAFWQKAWYEYLCARGLAADLPKS